MGILTGAIDKNTTPQVWAIRKDWLEPRLVIITLVALVASLFAEQLGAAGWLVSVFNVTAYLAGGFFGAKAAIEGLAGRNIDVDMLMILAALGAASIDQWHEGAVLLFLFSLSNVLQTYAIGRSRQAIRGLLKLYPDEAKIRRDERIQIVKIGQIHPGDVVLIEPGERIPVDGIVRVGRSAVDQSPITGESLPVEKVVGDRVFAGSLNQQGALDVEATQAAADTTLARIIKLVEEAQDSKAPTERFLDTFEQYYALFIIGSVALFIGIPSILNMANFESNFYRGMVLLTVASPCALVISTPASFISAIAAGARNGVLFKGGAFLEAMAAVKVIALDKTGTLTVGKPAVTDVVSYSELSAGDLLTIAAAVESRSEHPLAKAVVAAAREWELTLPEIDAFQALPGMGVVAQVNGKTVRLGSMQYLEQHNFMPQHLTDDYQRLEAQGKTVMGVLREHDLARGEREFGERACDWMGVIALADQLRPEAKTIVENLHRNGIERVAMLTGDNARVAETIAAQTGIDSVHAGLLPDEKVAIVKQLEAEYGPAAMVGDGINDAPALASASVGIAMGVTGADVALETADLVLMGDRLERLAYVLQLSRRARRIVWQNIAFSIAVIILLISGVFFVSLPLPLGVLGHEGSTVIVVLNGLIALLLWPEFKRRRNQIT